MENVIKSKKNINELMSLISKFSNENFEFSKELEKKYSGNFDDNSKDVLLFWFGSCVDDFSFIQSLISTYSALKSGNKVQLFSTKNNSYNNAIVKFVNESNLENNNFKFALIDENEFDSYKAYKRAKKFGSTSLFPHFNFWCIKNLKYERINILHNDNVFYGKIPYNQNDQIVCWVSTYSKKRHRKNRMIRKIISEFKIDKNDFLINHPHTGILSINNDVKIKFKDFLNENDQWISNNWHIFMYHEQELLAIVKQLNKFKLVHSNESKVWNFSEESFFLHYDENYKETLYLDDQIIINRNPHNFKNRHWDNKSINLIRESINDIINIISKG